jgi:dTDP-4-dehydrorhamnose reductase
MLGSQLLRTAPDGVTAVGTDLAEAGGVEHTGVDLADPEAVEALLEAAGPLAGVIHAAAYTAVDRAEEEEALALHVNARAPEAVAAACARRDLPLVLVSTDFVFDGTRREPYGEDDEPSPLGVYGRTKLEGERRATLAHPATAIVRTQWLYGPRGAHFPATMLRLAAERDELRVVDDQVGSPTSTLELAPALWEVLESGERGVFHAACRGECSWFDLAAATFELAGLDTARVQPCTTEEFPRPAPRPPFSVLDCSRLTALRGKSLAPWRDALADWYRADVAVQTS